MEIIISKPTDIDEEYLSQIVGLIVRGGQIKGDSQSIRILIAFADFVGFILVEETVVCTATLKNPYTEYKEKVFNLAGVNSANSYNKELGYIATHPEFENQGYCQKLLVTIFYQFMSIPRYATTRKSSMIHILSKLGFRKFGSLYNHDLSLLIYEPPGKMAWNNTLSPGISGNTNSQHQLFLSVSTELMIN